MSAFITRLEKGGKFISIINPKESYGAARIAYLPTDATLADALVLSGRIGDKVKLIRDGVEVNDDHIQQGDVIEIVDDSGYIAYPSGFDMLHSPAAIRLYKERMYSQLRDEYRSDDAERIKADGLKRGLHILKWLIDGYATQVAWGHDPKERVPSIEEIDDDILNGLIDSNRDLLTDIIDDAFILSLGLTARIFPTERKDFNLRVYNQWMRTQAVAEKIKAIYKWCEQNVYRVVSLQDHGSTKIEGDTRLVYQSFAHFLSSIAQPYEIVGIAYGRDEPHNKIRYKIIPAGKRTDTAADEIEVFQTSFQPFKRIIYLPIERGSMRLEEGAYIVVDPQQLQMAEQSMNKSNEDILHETTQRVFFFHKAI